MRIHRLKLNAYGPFPDEVDLNFEELNASGIFLLNGPTGSGKSSILDAICFALYGTTSLARPDLKSHFASPYAEPSVELDCTIGSARLYISRSPKWERPKKRGEGSVTEQAKVLIQRQLGNDRSEWETKATRNDEAGQYISSLIGLTREQFTQVMLLPQGEFARFLTAKSADREDLLKRLFPTDEFEKVQFLLNERAKEAEQIAENAQNQLEQLEHEATLSFQRAQTERTRELIAEIATTLPNQPELLSTVGKLAEDPLNTSVDDTSVSFENRVDLNIGWCSEHQQLTEVTLGLLTRALEKHRKDVNTKQQLINDCARYDKLLQEKASLEARRKTHEDDATQLDRARAARGVVPWHTALQRTLAEESKLSHHIFQLVEKLQERQQSYRVDAVDGAHILESMILSRDLTEDSDTGFDDLQPQIAKAIEQLRDLEQLEAQASMEEQRANSAQKNADQRVRQVEEQVQLTADLTGRIEQAEQHLVESTESLENLELLNLRVSQAHKNFVLASERDALTDRLETAQELAHQHELRRVALAEEAENLQRLRYSQAAQALAQELVSDQPCPVCGSAQHPHPARLTENKRLIEAKDVEAALEIRTRAEKTAVSSQQKVLSLRAQLERFVIEEVPATEQAQLEVKQAQQDLHHAQKAHRLVEEEKEKLNANRAKLVQQTERLQQLRITAETATTTAKHHKEQSKELFAQTHAHQATQSFSSRRAFLMSLEGSLQQLNQFREQYKIAVQRTHKIRDELNQALTETSFENIDQVLSHHLPDSEINTLTKTVESFREQVIRVHTLLNSESMQAVQEMRAHEIEAPHQREIEQLIQRISEHETFRNRLVAAATRTTTTIEELKKLKTRYSRGLAQSAHLIEDFRMKKMLSDIAAGNASENKLSMPLTTYVLAAQLEEVARASSLHLEQMTHSRYRIEYTDIKHGRGKSGLGIGIFDTWHNKLRLPATLSGGETFMASLALALGLADVVQQRNGGIEIDTLFVDEGFGSLDDFTLEEVMSTLDGLRERGRVIGLISHVAELKNRIPHHIQLTTSPEGSHLVA